MINKIRIALVLMFSGLPCSDAVFGQQPDDAGAYLNAPDAVMQRWDDLTFGLFLHWDMSSLLGVEISWAKQHRVDVAGEGEIPDTIYNNLYRSFNPAEFDANQFVKVAKDAGMRYVILTAKHHGGFCMFDSKLTDYKITNTVFGRDVVKELSDACHKEGMAFGLYYSQPDWHHADFMRKDFDAYRPYLFGQVKELCTNYGTIDILFFDGLFYGEKEYHSKELFKMIRTLQPDVVINNRAGLPGDYLTPEQVVGAFNNEENWESCMTLGTSWSWKVNDHLKSSDECIKILIQTVGGDGNLLLNVGPMPTGVIEYRQADTLKAVGDWLRKYGESIYANEGGPYKPAAWGASTYKDNIVYLHILSWDDAPEYFPSLGKKVQKVELLTGGIIEVQESQKGLKFLMEEKYRQKPSTIIKITLNGPAVEIDPILIPTKSIARNAEVTASINQHMAKNLVDDDPKTEWLSDSRQCWFEVDLGEVKAFNRIDIREEGHEWETRTNDYVLMYKSDNAWITLDKGNKIGHVYSRKFDPVSARHLRLQINNSGVLPKFSEFQVYAPK
ncbi:MAG: alpha-L-fucosidase [Bacteroidales bacterium]|nr:alpha-L-fucosidase [Bacteroidales bacterium]